MFQTDRAQALARLRVIQNHTRFDLKTPHDVATDLYRVVSRVPYRRESQAKQPGSFKFRNLTGDSKRSTCALAICLGQALCLRHQICDALGVKGIVDDGVRHATRVMHLDPWRCDVTQPFVMSAGRAQPARLSTRPSLHVNRRAV